MTTTKDIVSLQSIKFHRHNNPDWTLAIDTLDVIQGEKLFLYGPSGSGKTTLLDLLAGIYKPNKGSVKILDTDLTLMKARQRDQFRADHIGLIFQQFNLLPFLNVIDNVIMPCHFSKRRKEKTLTSGTPSEVAKNILDKLGFSENLFDRNVTELSVGEQQRVAVARALIGQPDLIIADEPTSALDQNTRNEFIELLLKNVADKNTTVIFVSHDESLANHFDRQLNIHSLSENNKVH